MAFDVASVSLSGQAGARPEGFTAPDDGAAADIRALLQAMVDADSGAGGGLSGSGPDSDSANTDTDDTSGAPADPGAPPHSSASRNRSPRLPLASGLDLRALRAAMRNAVFAHQGNAAEPALNDDRPDHARGHAQSQPPSESWRSADAAGSAGASDADPIVDGQARERHRHDAENMIDAELLIALAVQPQVPNEPAAAAGSCAEGAIPQDLAASEPPAAAAPATENAAAATVDQSQSGSKASDANTSSTQANGERAQTLSAGARALFQRLREQGILTVEERGAERREATQRAAEAPLQAGEVSDARASGREAVQPTQPATGTSPGAGGSAAGPTGLAKNPDGLPPLQAPVHDAQGDAGSSELSRQLDAAARVKQESEPTPGEQALDVIEATAERLRELMSNPANAPAAAESGARNTAAQRARSQMPRQEIAAGTDPAAAASFAAMFLEPMRAVDAPTPPSGHQQMDGGEAADSGLILRDRQEMGSLAHTAHALQMFAAVEQTAAIEQAAEPGVETPRGPALPNEQAVAATLVKSMHVQYRDGVGTAVVRLDPEYLGKVTVVLELGAGGTVTARMHAASGDVRAWLEANEQTLRQGLADKGLSLDRLVVVEEERPEDALSRDPRERESQQEQERRQRKPARRADAATFEVIV